MATKARGTIFTFNETAVGSLTSVGEIVSDSEALDVTTLDSEGGYREFMQGYRTGGELTLAGFHDKDDQGQAALRAAHQSGTAGMAVIAFPDGTTVSFSAFVKSCTLGAAEVNGAVGFGAVLRVSGAITVQEG